MTTAPVRLGIVGLGAMGAEVLRVAAAHRSYQVVAAADLDASTVSRYAPDHPGVRFTEDAGSVVTANDLDAVYIATPPATHAELVEAAFRAGHSVFCEKPLAVDLADGERMVEAAAKAAADVGAAAAVNFALSDRHATRHLERVLRDGAAGELRSVEVRLTFPRWPREFQAGAGWLDGRAQGGFVREVFSHFAYLTDRLVGPLAPIHLALEHRPGDRTRSEVAAFGLFRAGDVPVQVTAVAEAAGPESYEWVLRGSGRSYLLRDWSELFVAKSNEWAPVPLSGARGDEATRLTLFARAIRGDASADLADFATAYRVQQVVEAFHRGEVHG
ncbi:oxidoreductase domain protein [Kribbella flavida DSM 17836]|uniref:Oxidoreductase domain protein n=1 Tax=Kribbella flavida (strain DSM 17836 / JCM 10339 / NBRC 14399) TaxID=479435 RepID=D2PTM9_KRIFD|nr:Gfo/Idh/MocA family oxidoreductase [Kribbella flavida]ADB31342.1 oxidoreductase domain protein [Kribbella flavida DSM 17836]